MAGYTYRLWVTPSLLIILTASHICAQIQTGLSKSEKQLVPSTTSTKLPAGKKGCTSVCYALTQYGGPYAEFPTNPGYGIFYSLIGDRESIVHPFGAAGDGIGPNGNLAEDASGDLYGVTMSGGSNGTGTAFELDSSGNYSVIKNFPAPSENISVPFGGLVSDANGNLYGTISQAPIVAPPNSGGIFELTLSGGVWMGYVIYSFCYEFDCTDGQYPTGGLAIDSSGNLYGTTDRGGTNAFGTVFELGPEPPSGCPSGSIEEYTGWCQTVLYNFCSQGSCTDGSEPLSGVVLYNGSLFGTASEGGSSLCYCGVLYQLSPNGSNGWTYNVIHTFMGVDGANPAGELVFDSVGNLYGTTRDGGIPTGCVLPTYLVLALSSGCGTVFEWSSTQTFSVPYRFAGGLDGAYPNEEMTVDSSGNLYGATYAGGGTGCFQAGCGTAFKLTPLAGGLWAESIKYNFNLENGSTGALPSSGLKPR